MSENNDLALDSPPPDGFGRSIWWLDRVLRWPENALNLLAGRPGQAHGRVITPHPGEAGSLLASSARAVQADRPAALAGLVEKYGQRDQAAAQQSGQPNALRLSRRKRA